MTARFCDNDDCPDSWHWMDLHSTDLHSTDVEAKPEGCRDAALEDVHEGVVGSFFAA